MALLQISEPGMSTAPHQHRLAVGIDLGTTNSLVATVRNSIPEVLNDEDGRPLLPSVVRYLPNGHANIGYKALAAQTTDPKNTIVSVKRFMGRGLKDIAHAENLPYDFVDAPGMVQLKTVAGVKSPVETSAQILATLRQRAEDSLGDDLVGAVITVPAYFDDAQRQATKDAAKLAGLNVLRLLSEPTAAAIAYGLDNGSEGLFAVYDLGGGTFDISILKLSKGVFEVLSTGGDSALGGDDFDHRLFCWITSRRSWRRCRMKTPAVLMVKAREAKELLSTKAEVTVDAMLGSGEEVHLKITARNLRRHHQAPGRQDHERRAQGPARCRRGRGRRRRRGDGGRRNAHAAPSAARRQRIFPHHPARQHRSGQGGGAGRRHPGQPAGRQPRRRRRLAAAGRDPALARHRNHGRPGREDHPAQLDHSVRARAGIHHLQGRPDRLAVHVVQGERELVSDCRSLARFELRGIPPMAAGAARIRVTYQVDADGLLSVSARELRSGVEASITVKPSYGLGDDEVARMLQDSYTSADTDMKARALREEQVEAERILLATQSALDDRCRAAGR
jgi:molecular chaperone HscA